ncbi:Gag-Pro-Pol polyprotein [Turdus rufiventris]|nr:Gag-Pro-Pol polyprotein [Turdus rufiventris]
MTRPMPQQKGCGLCKTRNNCTSHFNIGAKALVKKCSISIADARHIVATCPHCQKEPLWFNGINPRGLKASEIWQSDFTLCQLLKPRAWLTVTVDTYSGMIVATQHAKANSKATIQHWVTAMVWLGISKQIKTDNGTNFVSKSVQEFATKWNITLKQGIPYNSTGQAIVERANQTLKSKLETLAKAEGFTNGIPPPEQPRLLATAMLALNQFPRGDQTQSPSQKHWVTKAIKEGPPVSIKNELGEWEAEWKLVTTGRGYAAVEKDNIIKWCPLKSIKPVLGKRSETMPMEHPPEENHIGAGLWILYYSNDEVLHHLEENPLRQKRELITAISLAVLLGLGAMGTAAGVSAQVSWNQGLAQLQTTVDEDLCRIQKTISDLEESVDSLAEVALQNRRGLDLLLMHQGDLCAALNEKCCFYANKSGPIR